MNIPDTKTEKKKVVKAKVAKKKVTKKTTTQKTTTKKQKSDTVMSSLGDKSLIIVESPTKARTLNKYLDKSYVIKATVGHVIDLPSRRIGVDVENNFKLEYETLPKKEKVIKELISAAKLAKEVLLATDPDREGEAIAWHVSQAIGKRSNKIHRVEFHEFTPKAVRKALETPSEINMKRVDAQQARRVLDRLVGYQVSPLLWKTITFGLSAGRVQSVALRQICEREVEIEQFIKEEYWTIDGEFKADKVDKFLARLFKLDKKKIEIPNEASSKTVVGRLKKADYVITDIRRSRRKRQPKPPYITSTLQQDAGRRLFFTTKRTMSVAQKLYEGINLGRDKGQTGLITYMRTDSLRVSDDAISDARDWIASQFGSEYVSSEPRTFKNKKGAIQDAHEAIRPADVSITPDSIKDKLTEEQYKLYNLIWRRFVATQMKKAEVDVTVITIGGREKGDENSAPKIEFRVSGQVLVFPGFLTVYEDQKNNDKDDDKAKNDNSLPSGLMVGMPLDLRKLDPKQHFTQPPPRYNESSLVKMLDEEGIGRPSTYAQIISTLLARKYVDKEEKVFIPTDLGKTVNKLLVERFPEVFTVEFTSKMEEQLDTVELGDHTWQQVVREFYEPFSISLEAALGHSGEIKKKMVEPVGRNCPDCGSDLLYKWSRNGKFIACSGYPKCKFSEDINANTSIKVDVKCPDCGSQMKVRSGKFGEFLGCSDYPKCKGILPITSEFDCPTEGCKGKLVKKKTKTGKIFYGCQNYPKCDFASWDNPIVGPCPECKAPTILEKVRKAGTLKHCHRCDWKMNE